MQSARRHLSDVRHIPEVDQAIRKAIETAGPRDTIVVAGSWPAFSTSWQTSRRWTTPRSAHR